MISLVPDIDILKHTSFNKSIILVFGIEGMNIEVAVPECLLTLGKKSAECE